MQEKTGKEKNKKETIEIRTLRLVPWLGYRYGAKASPHNPETPNVQAEKGSVGVGVSGYIQLPKEGDETFVPQAPGQSKGLVEVGAKTMDIPNLTAKPDSKPTPIVLPGDVDYAKDHCFYCAGNPIKTWDDAEKDLQKKIQVQLTKQRLNILPEGEQTSVKGQNMRVWVPSEKDWITLITSEGDHEECAWEGKEMQMKVAVVNEIDIVQLNPLETLPNKFEGVDAEEFQTSKGTTKVGFPFHLCILLFLAIIAGLITFFLLTPLVFGLLFLFITVCGPCVVFLMVTDGGARRDTILALIFAISLILTLLLAVGPPVLHWMDLIKIKEAFDMTHHLVNESVGLCKVHWVPHKPPVWPIAMHYQANYPAMRSCGPALQRICANAKQVSVCDFASVYPYTGFPIPSDPCSSYVPFADNDYEDKGAEKGGRNDHENTHVDKGKSNDKEVKDDEEKKGKSSSAVRSLNGKGDDKSLHDSSHDDSSSDEVCTWLFGPPGIWWTDYLVPFAPGRYCITWKGTKVSSWSLPSSSFFHWLIPNIFSGKPVEGDVDSTVIRIARQGWSFPSCLDIFGVLPWSFTRGKPTKRNVLMSLGLPITSLPELAEQEAKKSKEVMDNLNDCQREGLDKALNQFSNKVHQTTAFNLTDLVIFDTFIRDACHTSSYDTYSSLAWMLACLWFLAVFVTINDHEEVWKWLDGFGDYHQHDNKEIQVLGREVVDDIRYFEPGEKTTTHEAGVPCLKLKRVPWRKSGRGKSQLKAISHGLVTDFGWATFGLVECSQSEGKFYYEVELEDVEYPQIGFLTCDYEAGDNDNQGVGDDKNGWAVDPQRQGRWHGGKFQDVEDFPVDKEWGKRIRVGCVIDFDHADGIKMMFHTMGKYIPDAGFIVPNLSLTDKIMNALRCGKKKREFYPALSVKGMFTMHIDKETWYYAPDKYPPEGNKDCSYKEWPCATAEEKRPRNSKLGALDVGARYRKRDRMTQLLFQRLPKVGLYIWALVITLLHCIIPAFHRHITGGSVTGNSNGLLLTAAGNLLVYTAIIQYIMEKLHAFYNVILQLQLFAALTQTKVALEDRGRVSERNNHMHTYDLDLDGNVLLNKDLTIVEEKGSEYYQIDQDMALGIISSNLRAWLSMRDYLKSESTTKAMPIENMLVFCFLIIAGCMASLLYQRLKYSAMWNNTLTVICCWHILVFGSFAFFCVEVCAQANDKFDSHDDEIARNKEAYLRRFSAYMADLITREEEEKATARIVEGKLNSVQQMNLRRQQHDNILSLMDTIMQKISSKDVPITLLTAKIDTKFKTRMLITFGTYVFTFLVAHFADDIDKLKADLRKR